MIWAPVGLVFMKFGERSSYKILNSQAVFTYLLALLKSWITSQLWFVIVLKRKLFWCYEMRTFYLLVDIAIRFTILLGYLLNVCSKAYIHFVYFFLRCEFFFVFFCECKTLYWIIWGRYNGDPIGITLLKLKANGYNVNMILIW